MNPTNFPQMTYIELCLERAHNYVTVLNHARFEARRTGLPWVVYLDRETTLYRALDARVYGSCPPDPRYFEIMRVGRTT